MSTFRRTVALLACTALAAAGSAQTTWHVDASAQPGGDGLTWPTAFQTLSNALGVAVNGDQIWVAAGVYHPRAVGLPDPRSAEFLVRPGFSLYGGFAGFETSLAQRAGLFDQTVLSGDIGVPGDPSDNAYHVVRTWGIVVIDGFRISDGNAHGSLGASGGGVFGTTGQTSSFPPLSQGSAMTLRNCTIANNRAGRGAGIYAQLAIWKISLCTFENNVAGGSAGAVYLQASTARFDLCSFRRNDAGGDGGAVKLVSIAVDSDDRPRVQFFGCLFHDNTAASNGGAVSLDGSVYSSGKGAFTNCTFALNSAGAAGGGLHALTNVQIPARCYLENSIVWSNRAPIDPELSGHHWVWYSIAPGQTGTAVYSIAPKFVSPTLRDFRLRPTSLAIDVGSDARVLRDYLDVDGDGSLLELVPIDLDGQPRILGAHVDLGAYER